MPDEVTAGLDTVAIRVPAHPVAQALLQAAAMPVAAPSANLFSRPSPTRAAHVLEDLDGRIDLVLDGGPTQVGVESTVLDLTGDVPTVLRPGAVTLEMLRTVLPAVRMRGRDSRDAGPQRSPGLLTRHYSPRAPLTLYEGPSGPALERLAHDAREARAAGRRVGVLVADDDALPRSTCCVRPWARPAMPPRLRRGSTPPCASSTPQAWTRSSPGRIRRWKGWVMRLAIVSGARPRAA